MPENDDTMAGMEERSLAALTRLFELAARALHSAGHSEGLYPAQWTALRYLAVAAPAERTSSALARFQQMAVGPITRTVRTLVQKGLVVKAGVAAHHRSERLELTAAGHALLARDPLLAVDAAIGKLTPAQAKELAGVLGQIVSTLNTDDGASGAGFEATLLGGQER